MTLFPAPILVGCGNCPSGVSAGQYAPNTLGSTAVTGGTGLWNIKWASPVVPVGKLVVALAPLETGPGGGLTFGCTVNASGLEYDVQVRRSDTNAASDSAFSYTIWMMPSVN